MIRTHARVLRADIVATLCFSIIFWGYVTLLPGATVSTLAWVGLYLVCVAVGPLLWRFRWVSNANGWLIIAGYVALLSAMFFGFDVGLSLLHGTTRDKAHIAESLGGLEFWQALCPGGVALALAGWVRCRVISLVTSSRQK